MLEKKVEHEEKNRARFVIRERETFRSFFFYKKRELVFSAGHGKKAGGKQQQWRRHKRLKRERTSNEKREDIFLKSTGILFFCFLFCRYTPFFRGEKHSYI